MTLCLSLPKAERLCSRTLIDRLFTGGNKSMTAFPLRVVFMPVEGAGLPVVSVLFSVPVKRFKRAVMRNRVKRQLREAYRLHKGLLVDVLEREGKKAVIAFIWQDRELHASSVVEERVCRLLKIVAERL